MTKTSHINAYILRINLCSSIFYLFGFVLVNLLHFFLYSINMRNVNYLRIEGEYEQLVLEIRNKNNNLSIYSSYLSPPFPFVQKRAYMGLFNWKFYNLVLCEYD